MHFKAGLPVHFSKLILLGLLGLLFLAGCASIPGYPKPIEITLDEDCDDKDCRDNKIYALIFESDKAFEVYKRKLYKESVSFDLATDISRLGLEAAAAVTGGPGLKSALAATAGGLGAVQASVDKRVYFEQTLTAIIQLMTAKRDEVLVVIYEGLKKPIEEYPLGVALHDIRLYHASGSIPEALAEVVKEATERAEAAKIKVAEVIRTPEFVEERAQVEVEKLLEKADLLPSGKAWEILQNLPSELDDFTKSKVEEELGETQLSAAEGMLGGAENDANAKTILKLILY